MLREKTTACAAELLAKANKPLEDALKLHPYYRGKIETAVKGLALKAGTRVRSEMILLPISTGITGQAFRPQHGSNPSMI